MKISEINEAINRMADSGLINSGELVQLDPETLEIEVVSSMEDYTTYAPRVYEECSDRKAKDIWLAWTASVLTGDYHEPIYPLAAWRRETTKAIQARAIAHV